MASTALSKAMGGEMKRIKEENQQETETLQTGVGNNAKLTVSYNVMNQIKAYSCQNDVHNSF